MQVGGFPQGQYGKFRKLCEKIYAYEREQPPHKVAHGIQKRIHDEASLEGKDPVRRARCYTGTVTIP